MSVRPGSIPGRKGPPRAKELSMGRIGPAVVGILALVLGLAACSGVPAIRLDPESQTFFDTARLIMTDEETAIFSHLPDAESRQEFIRDFWTKRDPDPSKEENEFKREFERRIEYANKRFREGRKGIDTDRGRIYVFLGPPDKTEEFPFQTTTTGQGPVLWWIYYAYDLGIQFLDVNNQGTYRMDQISGNLMDAIRRAQLGAIYDSQGNIARFVDFTAAYDAAGGRIVVTVPAKKINFQSESGKLKVDFDFSFYVYSGAAKKVHFDESRTFLGTEEEIERSKSMTFAFPYTLPPGKNYVDIILIGREGIGKSRKIFSFKN